MHVHTPGKSLAITSVAALLLGVGGAASAAIIAGPVSGGVIYGCYTTMATGGSHVLVLQDKGTSCPSGDTAIKWNRAGRAGPPGPAGPSTAGASGLNVEVIQSSPDNLGQGRAEATCPSDHPYVLGGGSSQGSGSVAASFPVLGNGNGQGPEAGSGNGWEVQSTGFPSGPTIGAFAICAQ